MSAPRLANDCFALPPGVDWTPVDEALSLLRDRLTCVTGTETVPTMSAGGRILAAPAIAAADHPPHANSAIDGYGFAHGSLPQGDEIALPLTPGRAAAGSPFPGTVPPGTALRILTGAPIPDGVDTVILQEDVAAEEDCIRFRPGLKPGANTRKRGEDIRTGDTLLPACRRLTPADLATLASAGLREVTVHPPLNVAVLSTGDELASDGTPPTQGRIPDANRPMLLDLLSRWGFRTLDLGQAPDDASEVRARLSRAATEADALLTTGGASAGDEDHISAALKDHGSVVSWRIALKPGRPLALGMWQGTPVFGLPGNPVAAFVCALIFARPALSVLAGAGWTAPQAFTVPAAFTKRKKPGRREYLRARLDAQGAAEVFASEGSGRVSGLSWAEGLVELPDGALDVAPGTPVRYLPFTGFGL